MHKESVLRHFDASMEQGLDGHVNGKSTIKGNLLSYRFVEGVWTFVVDGANVKTENVSVDVGTLKIVSIDSKLSSNKQ